MDGFARYSNISIVAATNNIELVDEALLRNGRFDIKIEVPLPSVASRISIFEYYLGKVKLDPVLSVFSLASKYACEMDGVSGADIESFVKKAALETVYSGQSYITEDSLEKVLEVVA